MDLSNIKVQHNMLGVGTVIEFDSQYITVQFKDKTSKFVYPDAFDKFLKAEDPNVQEAIMADVFSVKQAEEERRQAEIAVRNAEEEKKSADRQNTTSAIKKPQNSADRQNTTSAIKKPQNIEDGFGADYNVAHLARQPILTYKEIEDQFNIKIAGFGRGINITPSTVVLISSVDKKKSGFVYHDRWTADGDYIYSGEGKIGDQKMTSRNRAIVDAAADGKVIHLFVKFSPQEYYYQGVFKLVDHTYENDKDENGNTRKEYKFRLRRVN